MRIRIRNAASKAPYLPKYGCLDIVVDSDLVRNSDNHRDLGPNVFHSIYKSVDSRHTIMEKNNHFLHGLIITSMLRTDPKPDLDQDPELALFLKVGSGSKCCDWMCSTVTLYTA